MKSLMLEKADINWETDDREIRQFMYHWCEGDDCETIADELNRTTEEVILLMLHIQSINALIKRPNGIFGFEGHPNRKGMADVLFKTWQMRAPKVLMEEMSERLEREEKRKSRIAT